MSLKWFVMSCSGKIHYFKAKSQFVGCLNWRRSDYHGSLEARVPLLVWALMGDLILSLHGEEEPERDALGDVEEIGGQGSKLV